MPEQFLSEVFLPEKPRPKWFLRSVLRANPGALKASFLVEEVIQHKAVSIKPAKIRI